MKKNDFEFIIGSPFDRNKLICEIYYKNEIIGEISQETNELMIELFLTNQNNSIQISLSEFQEALVIAKNHLLGIK